MYVDGIDAELPAQKLIAEARGFNVCFDRWLYPRDLSFAWRGGVRVALAGPNGCGKSVLLRALMGEPLRERGRLWRGDVACLYLDQAGASLTPTLSVLENARRASSAPETELRGRLARFLFSGASVFQRVADLSGGERLRAALACGLLAARRPDVLILDEPTNNLDLANIAFLEAWVAAFRGAVVAVSHDTAFLEACGVTETLSLSG
jgi:ATPase subunit of ABC transporter with duplicated ATPase domains